MMPILICLTISAAVAAYAPTQTDIIFNHAAHFSERSIDCATCHDVTKSTMASDKNIPGHDVCSACHSVEKSPDDCRLCHANPENPVGVIMPPREIVFAHSRHTGEAPKSQVCLECHQGVDTATGELSAQNYPPMQKCFQCHDGIGVTADCKACHTQSAKMAQLVHPPDWKHSHKFEANADGKSCAPCHQNETFCSDCHAGDNLTGFVHDLNYRYNHGLDAKAKEFECQSCHDFQTFCSECHDRENAIPLNHLNRNWSPRNNPIYHAIAARQDIEACASCHDENRSTCAQPGCHNDSDGIRGTNPSIHPSNIDELGKGPWHDDRSFQCYQCHAYTGVAGVGFCGYCHGDNGD